MMILTQAQQWPFRVAAIDFDPVNNPYHAEETHGDWVVRAMKTEHDWMGGRGKLQVKNNKTGWLSPMQEFSGFPGGWRHNVDDLEVPGAVKTKARKAINRLPLDY